MNLYEALKETVSEQQITTAKHKITLSSHKLLIGVWDKEKLKRVFTNLLSNAIKYTPNGGTISINVKKTHNAVRISVSDRGIGMTAQQSHLLFQPFVRQYEGEKTIEGTGLGLYISKSIIEAHYGKIWVTSQKGKGSTFFVELPFA